MNRSCIYKTLKGTFVRFFAASHLHLFHTINNHSVARVTRCATTDMHFPFPSRSAFSSLRQRIQTSRQRRIKERSSILRLWGMARSCSICVFVPRPHSWQIVSSEDFSVPVTFVMCIVLQFPRRKWTRNGICQLLGERERCLSWMRR